ncbi:hypothetical protein UA08_08015 [Talaromyces atroroseus]|uniref:Phosphonoacetate hydrolase n=1 Tax=Talaromyces atroroseus TaxID=1441469 RepID=A0A225ACS2_TALAT|nr:hypothetical protein UA08_08015 [Talaromyces atroroseus]OKL56703.1 hypothetical protein UA08_08015 [Talaromyces atroroseus]
MTAQVLGPSIESQIEALFSMFSAQGQAGLELSLQRAHLARQDHVYGRDDEVVLAALLYEVACFIPAGEKVEESSHDALGEYYLRSLGFGGKVAGLVGTHVMTMRYLAATEKDYYDGLSEGSKKTLLSQGGIFSQEQVKQARDDPLLGAKLALRRWYDLAEVPNIGVQPLSDYKDIAYRCLSVVICVDGFDPEYLRSGVQGGILPTMKEMVEKGFHTTAKSCMPSFTNPNNVSIITGMPPSIHGIAGNFFLDRETGKETMITDDSLLRGSTLLEQMSIRGVRVAAITAKDKLRKILAHGLKEAICFSAERAGKCTLEENGIENVEDWIGRSAPSQYSGDLSLFVLDAGIKLLEEGRSDFLYLTLSDYIQHKYAPGSKQADEFMKGIDARLKKLIALAPIVGVTGDHGMSQKSNAEGEPNILFLEDSLGERFGTGSSRVICPITDPFVRHHGALGSFVRVYLKDLTRLDDVLAYCQSLPYVDIALSGKEAAEKYDMPLDREGDIVVISKPHTVIGSRKAEHDLSQVRDHPLRSHGGISEQDIPIIASKPVRDVEEAITKAWRNYDIFDLVLNWV